MKATIYTDSDGLKHEVKGNCTSDIMQNISDFLFANKYDEIEDDILIKIGCLKFWWDASASHYCFAKGRISIEHAYMIMVNGNN